MKFVGECLLIRPAGKKHFQRLIFVFKLLKLLELDDYSPNIKMFEVPVYAHILEVSDLLNELECKVIDIDDLESEFDRIF
ncbi:MAG: hypothetical protein ACFFBD_13805 [Candidatus Hodarchaeota archaeon]